MAANRGRRPMVCGQHGGARSRPLIEAVSANNWRPLEDGAANPSSNGMQRSLHCTDCQPHPSPERPIIDPVCKNKGSGQQWARPWMRVLLRAPPSCSPDTWAICCSRRYELRGGEGEGAPQLRRRTRARSKTSPCRSARRRATRSRRTPETDTDKDRNRERDRER